MVGTYPLPVAFNACHQVWRELPIISGVNAANKRRIAERIVLNIVRRSRFAIGLGEVRREVAGLICRADIPADVDTRPIEDLINHRGRFGVGPRAEIGGKRGGGADASENSCQNNLFHVNPDDILAAFDSDGSEPGLCFSNHADAKPDCVSSAIKERLPLAGPSSDRRILPQFPDLDCGCGRRNTFLVTLAGCRPSPTSAGLRSEAVDTTRTASFAGGFHALVKRCPLRPQGYGFA